MGIDKSTMPDHCAQFRTSWGFGVGDVQTIHVAKVIDAIPSVPDAGTSSTLFSLRESAHTHKSHRASGVELTKPYQGCVLKPHTCQCPISHNDSQNDGHSVESDEEGSDEDEGTRSEDGSS
jgi:hypothetical protein